MDALDRSGIQMNGVAEMELQRVFSVRDAEHGGLRGFCRRRPGTVISSFLALLLLQFFATHVLADEANVGGVEAGRESFLNLRSMLAAGGLLGYVIVGLSFVMVALIVDHMMNIRRSTLMPPGLAEEVHRCLAEKNATDARKYCREHPGFLSRVLHAGLDEIGTGYSPIEKAMEDAAVEQSARLFRRIEYLSVISALAPMLGLMGTVWGMILAFVEFEQKANPQVSELAPGIYKALITTLMGLGVAIPSLAAFAIFRNRIDELSAEATLLAEYVFSDYRRSMARRSSGSQSTTRSGTEEK
ncbi:MAG: MotA/TolQ/ExbB proton channel family protein [Planctomycetaceae bacterium]|nr:MotA/TolQ/ExbB proton channel family protein [Planctomycetaceae bacterium]